jgi:hypothetical protein
MRLLFVLLLFFSYPRRGSCQEPLNWFEWVKEMNVDTIDVPGKKHVFIQKCMPKTDSMIITGKILFSNAKIKSIGSKCIYTINLIDTIIRSIEIQTNQWSNEENVFKYFKKLANNKFSMITYNKNCDFFSSVLLNYGKQITITYLRDKKRKSLILHLEAL